jgi:hypothetical protein
MIDEPMPEKPVYDEWLASRRAAKVPSELTDRVMAAVEKQVVQRKHYVRLADRINESQPARMTACLAALLVGFLPFLYVAYAAQSFAF